MKFDALAAADRKDLVRLAELLEAGLLTPPMSALSLRDHMAAAHAESVAQCLEQFSAEGMPAAHIALMLRAFTARAQAAGGRRLLIACRNGCQWAGCNRRRTRYRRRHAAAVRQGA